MVERVPVGSPEVVFDRLMERIENLETMVYGRNASVHDGSTEFVGEDSLIVRGSQLVSGWLRVIGRLVVTGLGILEVNGLIDLLGRMKVRGGGGITVEDGGDIDVLGGMIRAGLVRMEDGKLFVGESMVLDPAEDGGAALFSNGSKLYSNATAIGLRKGSSSLTVGETLAALLVGGKAFTVAADGFTLTGVDEEESTDGVMWLGLKGGKLVVVSPAVGGPFGNLSWPLPPSTVTDEYGPRESPGEGASTFHEGIDFGAANGTPIPSAGAGTVEFAGFDTDGGYGNYVLINHGGELKTRYAHMNATPQVTTGAHVARGQILGEVGDTGTSFGNHLHFEVEYQGVRVNPRSKLPAA
ncbi:MAG: M23 family metallopeptidase [Microbacterium enclense]